ncbi:MAG: hypothetical protein EA344_01925 [Alkalicoccus sp.]|nr:MAG: hypothetical protein EA344_01925 [Alkalicoccus sp.]
MGSSNLLLPRAGFRFVFRRKRYVLLFVNAVLSSVKPMPGQRRLRKKKAGRSSRTKGQPRARQV